MIPLPDLFAREGGRQNALLLNLLAISIHVFKQIIGIGRQGSCGK